MHYGDAIRILGTIAVVVGHVGDMALFSKPPLSTDWLVCNTWDAAARWAVPAYIMLSGSLLLDPARAETPRNFYRKRLARVGVPLVFWSIFFMWFAVYYTGWDTLHQEWIRLLKGQPYAHLHFIFRVAGLYAFTPMIRVFLRHTERRMQVTVTIMILAFASCDSIANSITGTEYSAFARFVPFLGYYLLGYLLREAIVDNRGLLWCWIGYIGSVIVLAGGTDLAIYFTDAKRITSTNMMLYEFLSPVRIGMGICAWLILVRLFHKPWPKSEKGRRWLRFYADTTLGLYLIHPAFREFFYLGMKVGLGENGHRLLSHGINGWWPNVWIGVPMTSVLVYVPSLIATIIIMRIPYVRRIMG